MAIVDIHTLTEINKVCRCDDVIVPITHTPKRKITTTETTEEQDIKHLINHTSVVITTALLDNMVCTQGLPMNVISKTDLIKYLNNKYKMVGIRNDGVVFSTPPVGMEIKWNDTKAALGIISQSPTRQHNFILIHSDVTRIDSLCIGLYSSTAFKPPFMDEHILKKSTHIYAEIQISVDDLQNSVQPIAKLIEFLEYGETPDDITPYSCRN